MNRRFEFEDFISVARRRWNTKIVIWQVFWLELFLSSYYFEIRLFNYLRLLDLSGSIYSI